MNKKLLQNWVNEGLAVTDLGDGAWGWTELGKKMLPGMTRDLLSDLLYNKTIPSYMKKDITDYGFDKEGFALTDE